MTHSTVILLTYLHKHVCDTLYRHSTAIVRIRDRIHMHLQTQVMCLDKYRQLNVLSGIHICINVNACIVADMYAI